MRRCTLAAPKTRGAHELCLVIPDTITEPMVAVCSRCGDFIRISMALPMPVDDWPADAIQQLAKETSMSRRIAYVLMSWDVVLAAAASHSYGYTSTLPADARVSYLVLEHERQQVKVYFESDTLDPVIEGGAIPEFVVSVTAHYPVPVAS